MPDSLAPASAASASATVDDASGSEAVMYDLAGHIEGHVEHAMSRLRRCDRDLVNCGTHFGKHFLQVGSGDEVLTHCARGQA